MDTDKPNHLAWFLGPKAENSEIVERLLLEIIRDYFHWRRNYFPGDPIQISQLLQREFVNEHDCLNQHVHELLAMLRRNFPFYSPRYIAHQLSDTVIASTLGYFAGMLYNPNNVTPEAAPVTTELEIEACNAILTMLGYTPAPPPPNPGSDVFEYYQRFNHSEFGWAHITSGGTIANIEALWTARQVRYFPLAVQELAIAKNLNIEIKLPNARTQTQLKSDKGTTVDIRSVDPYKLLLIKPNESIYLLSKIVTAMRPVGLRSGVAEADLGQYTWALLAETESSLSNGTGKIFAKYPPTILVAGSRHYSIAKAADMLGIGSKNIMQVKCDHRFRIDISDLENKLMSTIEHKRVPLCVFASVGTTEEGAVDPVHEIIDLRTRMEREHDVSFWLHIDAAWGGYIRSLFCLEPADQAQAIASKMGKAIDIPFQGNLIEWQKAFSKQIETSLTASEPSLGLATSLASDSDYGSVDTLESADPIRSEVSVDIADSESTQEVASEDMNNHVAARSKSSFTRDMRTELQRMATLLEKDELDAYVKSLTVFPHRFSAVKAVNPSLDVDWRLNLLDTIYWVQNYTSQRIEDPRGKSKRLIDIEWPTKDVGSAFVAIPYAESVTIDPHKMGYAHYPCGCIAFRNDLVRSFVVQKAPYITSMGQEARSAILHLPPRHTKIPVGAEGMEVVTEAFSPFTLEGSRAGAAASSLWLSIKTIPLTARSHGAIIRESIVAARIIYEMITRWTGPNGSDEDDIEYAFHSLTPNEPDTNIVTFVAKKKASGSLAKMNKLTKSVYARFSIQSELGECEYSYSQPFFLSNTVIDCSQYPIATVKAFADRIGLSSNWSAEYQKEGITILRASVMNPYINHARHGETNLRPTNFAELFVHELGHAAREAAKAID